MYKTLFNITELREVLYSTGKEEENKRSMSKRRRKGNFVKRKAIGRDNGLYSMVVDVWKGS